jgi:SARP family transcriptional regulator, regulator of embCAB operon
MRLMSMGDLGKTLGPAAETRIHLCGRFTVRLRGARVEDDLPGRQGRILFAYLAAHRVRPTPRAGLLRALWPGDPPAAAESALNALLAKLRRVLGSETVAGKHDVQLQLAPDAWVDVEAAADALHRAESAMASKDWARAWGPARVALHIAERRFMSGHEAPWITLARQNHEDMLIRANECVAASCLALGGAEIATAERAARRLLQLAPYRESGYRMLMKSLAAKDNIGEALMVYEQLRKVLRDELGASPSATAQSLHLEILKAPATCASRITSPSQTAGPA